MLLAVLSYHRCPLDKAPNVSHSQCYGKPDRERPDFAPHLQASLTPSRPHMRQNELHSPSPQLMSHTRVFTLGEGQGERRLLVALWKPSQQLLQQLFQLIGWLQPVKLWSDVNSSQARRRRDGGSGSHVRAVRANKRCHYWAVSSLGSRQRRGRLVGPGDRRVQERKRECPRIGTWHDHGNGNWSDGKREPGRKGWVGLECRQHEICLRKKNRGRRKGWLE